MTAIEVARNIYVAHSVTESVLDDPWRWLDGRENFALRHVGGLHNLTDSDKEKWARDTEGPLRIVESQTGREEIWFPTYVENYPPVYISLNAEGRLQSHHSYRRKPSPGYMPAVSRRLPLASFSGGPKGKCEINIWYEDNLIHHIHDGCGLFAKRVVFPIKDKNASEYINLVGFRILMEDWDNGEWKHTVAEEFFISFVKKELNTPEHMEKAKSWICQNCKHGFFPLSERLFGNEEEEFLFLADVCHAA